MTFRNKMLLFAAGIAGGYWLATSKEGQQLQKQISNEATKLGNAVSDNVQTGLTTVNSKLGDVRSQVNNYTDQARGTVTNAKGYLVDSLDSIQTNVNRGFNKAKTGIQNTAPQVDDQIQNVESSMEEHLTAAQNKLRRANQKVADAQPTLNGVG